MVDVEVVLGFIVHVYLELGDVVLGFGGDKEVVCWEYLEFSALVIFRVLCGVSQGPREGKEIIHL